MYMFLADISQC